MVYLLALLGALACAIGDVVCVAAARGWRPILSMTIGTLAWALCAPIWFAMSRRMGGGFVQPAALWEAATALMSIPLAVMSGDRQTRGEWVGFALVMLGAVVRAAGK